MISVTAVKARHERHREANRKWYAKNRPAVRLKRRARYWNSEKQYKPGESRTCVVIPQFVTRTTRG